MRIIIWIKIIMNGLKLKLKDMKIKYWLIGVIKAQVHAYLSFGIAYAQYA